MRWPHTIATSIEAKMCAACVRGYEERNWNFGLSSARLGLAHFQPLRSGIAGEYAAPELPSLCTQLIL